MRGNDRGFTVLATPMLMSDLLRPFVHPGGGWAEVTRLRGCGLVGLVVLKQMVGEVEGDASTIMF